ncbi:hypothetical protein C8Q77DRAFT_1088280 [Trametes polyzona]|nr:hypothetical protein C8Q77DRAFT_1088280 [Trametes polyzona]
MLAGARPRATLVHPTLCTNWPPAGHLSPVRDRVDMPPKKKKGPPYTDDPGCKYIVIEDPWPGDATGKARTQVFYNRLCAWVYFMLGKTHEVEAVFSVNTRNEVIVQLPQSVDLAPILGAHPWRRCLMRGDPKDKDRVSYVFEYDYRNRGEPGNHNWLETLPTVSGDPPPHLRFPVVFPYPHVSWASPKGKNCADLALPLPPVRRPTPVPDTSLFQPYQHPSQLTGRTVENAQAAPEERTTPESRGNLHKSDPYDQETAALRSLKQEIREEKPLVKTEGPDGRVKLEPEPYGPSKAFRQAVERRQQAERASHGGTPSESSPVSSNIPVKTEQGTVKSEPDLYGPSRAFRRAVEQRQQAQVPRPSVHQEESPKEPHIKPDVSDGDTVPAPSDAFRAAFEKIRGTQSSSPGSAAIPPCLDSPSTQAVRRGSSIDPRLGASSHNHDAGYLESSY